MSLSVKGLIGILAALTLLCGGGGYLFVKLVLEDQHSEAHNFGRRAVLAIASTWDSKALIERATSAYKSQFTPQEFDELLAGPKKSLGTFVKGKSKARITSAEGQGAGGKIEAAYENNAEFAKGKAIIRMKLQKEKGGKWEIAEFRIDPTEG